MTKEDACERLEPRYSWSRQKRRQFTDRRFMQARIISRLWQTRSGACNVCMVDERCFRPERHEHFWSTRVAGFDFMSFTVSVLEEWT